LPEAAHDIWVQICLFEPGFCTRVRD
jgi:hypothetical protein